MQALIRNERSSSGSALSAVDGGVAAAPAGVPSPAAPSLIDVMLRRWQWLAGSVIACLALTGGYLYLATPIYSASSRIAVEQNAPRVFNENAGNTQLSESFLQTQADILQSTPVLARALDSVGYRRLETFADVRSDPIAWLRRSGTLKVEVGRKSDVLSVSIESASSVEAASLANAIVDAFVAEQTQRRRETGGEMVRVLQQQKDALTSRREAAMRQMIACKREQNVSTFREDHPNAVVERSEALTKSLTEAELATFDLRAQRDAIKAALADPAALSAFVESQQFKAREASDRELDELRSQLNQSRLTMSTAMETQGPNHPRVLVMEQMIESLTRRIAAKERSIADAHLLTIETQLKAAEAKERAVRAAMEGQQVAAVAQAPVAMQYAKLETEVAQLQKQEELLDARIAEVSVNSVQSPPMNVRVLEAARAEERPVRPNKPLTAAAGLIAGVLLGVGSALAVEWSTERRRSRYESEYLIGVPVVASVPRMRVGLSWASRGQIAGIDLRSPAAEAFRAARESLLAGPAGNARTILICSPAHGDGRSTVASNVAIALAQAGQRTLLVDCDLREPVQHLAFGGDAVAGVTSVLDGSTKLRDSIFRTRFQGLYLLPAGPQSDNPANLFAGPRFERLMRALGHTFDRIVIDSPAMMRCADGRLLATMMDATMLVFRRNQSMRTLGAMALESLCNVGANVVGTVANDTPPVAAARGADAPGPAMALAAAARRALPVARSAELRSGPPRHTGSTSLPPSSGAKEPKGTGDGNEAQETPRVAAVTTDAEPLLVIEEPDFSSVE